MSKSIPTSLLPQRSPSAGILAGAPITASPEARLRDALRNTMLQLRSVTTERDNLQAQETDMESQKNQFAAQVTALTKQSAADKDAYPPRRSMN